ncbi:MAG: hypothetical protein AB1595_00100 [bacterium]
MNKKIFIIGLLVYGMGFLFLYLKRLFLGPFFITGGLVIIPISILLAKESKESRDRKV